MDARRSETAAVMALAIAAVSVDGRCRERSPADLALFGEARDRFVDRFETPEEGQSLLAAAIGAGTAETTARLRTQAGVSAHRVSLWRQRGGERIRLVAAFAGPAADDPAPRRGPPAAPPGAGDGALCRALEATLGGLIFRAEAARCAADGAEARAAADILAGAWRAIRLAQDIARGRCDDAGQPAGAGGEVDIAALCRRVLHMLSPALGALEIRAGLEVAETAPGTLVAADQALLSCAIEGLVTTAAAASGAGGAVALVIAGDGAGGLGLSVRAEPAGHPAQAPYPGDGAARRLSVEDCGELLRAAGARLDGAGPGGAGQRVLFPAARCLGAI